MDDLHALIGHIHDLDERADEYCCRVYSDFLSLSEQSSVIGERLRCKPVFWGGYEDSERKIVCLVPSECMYEDGFPISVVEICPVSAKFAEDLSHRDFLGSVLGIGITRNTVGDIIVSDNKGYVFCSDSIAEVITMELKKVRKTDVVCTLLRELPEVLISRPDVSRVVVSSARLDSLVSAGFKLSRSEAQRLFENEKVFLNGKAVSSYTGVPQQGDIISVRGMGRLVYEGESGKTKKDRTGVLLRIYK